MSPSNIISRPQEQELQIVALLSTERGRRSAMLSSIQCLLSVVGSMGIILLFAGIPQLIYSPVVTVTNVVTFLMGALLLSVMVAGNACIGYKFRAEIDQIRGVLRESHTSEEALDDKPPNYDDLSFGEPLPPDYYSVVTSHKTARALMCEESSQLVEVVPTHTPPHRPLHPGSSPSLYWHSELDPPSTSSSSIPHYSSESSGDGGLHSSRDDTDTLWQPSKVDNSSAASSSAVVIVPSNKISVKERKSGGALPRVPSWSSLPSLLPRRNPNCSDETLITPPV